MNLRKMRFVAGAVAVATAFALATPASALPRAQEVYDCDQDYGVDLTHAIPEGTTLTVNFVSCGDSDVDDFYVDSGSLLINGAERVYEGWEWSWPGDNSLVTITAGTTLYTESDSEISVPVAQEVADPSGSLLATSKAVFGRNPAEYDFDTEFDEYFFMNDDTCDIAPGTHVYKTTEIKVNQAGEYTIRAVGSNPTSDDVKFDHADTWNPLWDSALAVYPTFSKGATLDNKRYVGCNDDANDTWESDNAYVTGSGIIVRSNLPWATMHLRPGRYTLVWLTYENTDTYNWSRGYDSDENWIGTTGSTSLTYEVWGPAGSLVK